MREDMFKVIVERPRRGRSWACKTKNRYLKKDDGRRRVSGKRLAYETGGTKYLNENLAPLRRYLFKQRGRKWDDVFSDICARLDTGSTVKMHVREHLDDFVVSNVRIDETGMYWGPSHWGCLRTPDQWYADLYVCPVDGRLKETELLRRKLGLKKRRYFSWRDTIKAPSPNLKRFGDTEFLIRQNGLWFFVSTNRKAYGEYYSDQDIFDTLQTIETSSGDDLIITFKKQLSKKELKKHGLKNGGDHE